jgi:hypothetical protein
MSRKFLFLAIPAVLSLGFVVQAAARDLIPAGTLLHCTMDEVNFSPKTAQVGDPVLCNLGPLGSFGHSVFPRGAQLSGHLQDYKAPGHFWGKGWMNIAFDRMILPGAQVLPLDAKIVGAPHNKVDADGDIKGKGHPKRDAILWAVPLFWPVKVLTLPARGPYPALKGENRLTLKLMEDVEVPFSTARNSSIAPMPDYRPSGYRGNSQPQYQPSSSSAASSAPSSAVTSAVTSSASSAVTAQADRPVIRHADFREALLTRDTPAVQPAPEASTATNARVTVIALHAGSALLASRYWAEGTTLHCVSTDGAEQTVPLAMVDLPETVKVNQERNVDFALRSVHPANRITPIEQ